jgi:hypothetical protein
LWARDGATSLIIGIAIGLVIGIIGTVYVFRESLGISQRRKRYAAFAAKLAAILAGTDIKTLEPPKPIAVEDGAL